MHAMGCKTVYSVCNYARRMIKQTHFESLSAESFHRKNSITKTYITISLCSSVSSNAWHSAFRVVTSVTSSANLHISFTHRSFFFRPAAYAAQDLPYTNEKTVAETRAYHTKQPHKTTIPLSHMLLYARTSQTETKRSKLARNISLRQAPKNREQHPQHPRNAWLPPRADAPSIHPSTHEPIRTHKLHRNECVNTDTSAHVLYYTCLRTRAAALNTTQQPIYYSAISSYPLPPRSWGRLPSAHSVNTRHRGAQCCQRNGSGGWEITRTDRLPRRRQDLYSTFCT